MRELQHFLLARERSGQNLGITFLYDNIPTKSYTCMTFCLYFSFCINSIQTPIVNWKRSFHTTKRYAKLNVFKTNSISVLKHFKILGMMIINIHSFDIIFLFSEITWNMYHVTISKIHIMQHAIQKSIDTQTSNCEYYKQNMKCIVQIKFNGIVMKCMFTRDYCIFCTIPVFTKYNLYN